MSETRLTIEERLYALLPAVHRIRDQTHGEALRALLAILEHELLAVKNDTQGLYDDWFIETCKEWVAPYIGDLLGVELLRSIEAEGFTQRAYVANTLRYRRRKGTAAVLEQLARDVTGWPARAEEYFERLATAQHVQHVRLQAPATTSLRDATALELVDGPLGHECHSVDVRSIAQRRGRFNIPNVGLHLWRLRHYPLQKAQARALEHAGVDPGRYHFDVLGSKQPLFNTPLVETDIAHLADERNLPARLRRRALYAEREHGAPSDGWLGDDPVFRVWRVDGAVVTRIEPPELCICHLDVAPDDPATDWPRPDTPGHVNVDPETGRLAFPAPAIQPAPDAVLVSYAYGFSANLGAGPYDRRSTVPDRIDVADASSALSFQQGVSKSEGPVRGETIHSSLADAIDAWNVDALTAWAAGGALERVVTVMDSRSYDDALTLASGHCIVMPAGSRLRIYAASWPREAHPDGGEQRTTGRLDPSDLRPHLQADLDVLGIAEPGDERARGALELDGFLIEGGVTVLPGDLGALALRHCALVPGHGGLRVASTASLSDPSLRSIGSNASLELSLTRCIADGVTLTAALGKVHLEDCIVDTGAQLLAPLEPPSPTIAVSATPLGVHLSGLVDAGVNARLAATPFLPMTWSPLIEHLSVAGLEANVDIDTSTLFGPVRVRGIDGSESLFVGRVEARVVQEGCLRYSYAPIDSRAPRRFKCQPDLALEAAKARASDAGLLFDDADAISARLRPLFTSTTYGHAAYGQLARLVANELWTGSEDGSEMGAFNLLKQAHRESNLLAALEHYLRFSLDAGMFYAT